MGYGRGRGRGESDYNYGNGPEEDEYGHGGDFMMGRGRGYDDMRGRGRGRGYDDPHGRGRGRDRGYGPPDYDEGYGNDREYERGRDYEDTYYRGRGMGMRGRGGHDDGMLGRGRGPRGGMRGRGGMHPMDRRNSGEPEDEYLIRQMAEEFAVIKSQQEKLLQLRGMGPNRRPPRRGGREPPRGRGGPPPPQSEPPSLVPYGDDDDKDDDELRLEGGDLPPRPHPPRGRPYQGEERMLPFGRDRHPYEERHEYPRDYPSYPPDDRYPPDSREPPAQYPPGPDPYVREDYIRDRPGYREPYDYPSAPGSSSYYYRDPYNNPYNRAPTPPPLAVDRDLKPTVIDYSHGQASKPLDDPEKARADEEYMRRRAERELPAAYRDFSSPSRDRDRARERDRYGNRERERNRSHSADKRSPDRRRSSRSPERRRSPSPGRGDRRRSRERGERASFSFDRAREERDRRRRRSRSPLKQRSRSRSRDRRDPFGRDVPRPHNNRLSRSSHHGLDLSPNGNLPITKCMVEDLLCSPGRQGRPKHFVIIVRGLPGSGKSYVCKLLKDKEVANHGSAPRMLCLDDYFITEVTVKEKDPESGKMVEKVILDYEYDAALEASYRQSLTKSFKKQVDNLLFNFIIVDAVFDKVDHFEEIWSYAKSKGFQVYVAEVEADVSLCAKRNTHKRTLEEIKKLHAGWQESPAHMIRLDIRSLLQDAAITDVEMEVAEAKPSEETKDENDDEEEEEEDDDDIEPAYKKSRWEIDTTEDRLDRLEGLAAYKKRRESAPQGMDDYLQLPDDYDTRTSRPGQKRVRWADIEERKQQIRSREIGFVVGQTNWDRLMDDSYADRALNQTKYF